MSISIKNGSKPYLYFDRYLPEERRIMFENRLSKKDSLSCLDTSLGTELAYVHPAFYYFYKLFNQ